MAANKTKQEAASVDAFIASIEDATKREDCVRLMDIMQAVAGEEPVMWGTSMVGFGKYHYRYKSGREGDFFLTGFSPRKSALTIYIMEGFDRDDSLMSELGTYKTGKSCLYVKRLSAIDEDALKRLIAESVEAMRKRYPNEQ